MLTENTFKVETETQGGIFEIEAVPYVKSKSRPVLRSNNKNISENIFKIRLSSL